MRARQAGAIIVVLATMACDVQAAGLGRELHDDPDLAAGDIFQILDPLAALGVTLYKHDGQGSRQYGYSFLATFAATEALKYAFDGTRWGERPNGGGQSFPSGHTSSACSAAAFLDERYGWQYGVPVYATALFTAYSRVDEHYHHWRDVIAGCALAYGVSRLIATPYVEDDRVSLLPLIDRDTIGLQLRMVFAR